MKYKIYPFKISVLVVASLVTMEITIAENELFDHPLFSHQARKNTSHSEYAPNPIKDLEMTTQPGCVKWAAAQIFDQGEQEQALLEQSKSVQPCLADIKVEPQQPAEGWGSWLYQSIGSSISYAGQVMNTMIQSVFGSTHQEEEKALEVMISSQGTLEEAIVETVTSEEDVAYKSPLPDMPKFDTITYVEGMQEILMRGLENSDPVVVAAIQKKDEEVRLRFAGLPEGYSEALRKAQWLRALDGNYQEVSAIRHLQKNHLKRRILSGSIFVNPAVRRTN